MMSLGVWPGFLLLLGLSLLAGGLFLRQGRRLRGLEQELTELRAGAGRFRDFIENANDIFFSLDAQGRILYLSPTWQDWLGSDPARFIGQSFEVVIHPDDLPACQAFVHRVLTTQSKQSGIEYRVCHADGGWRWHTSNVSPSFDAEGRLVGLFGIGRDIEARKRTEEALRISEMRHRLLADNARDVIWTMEYDGRISYVSPSIEQVRGLSPEEAMRQPLDQIHPPDSMARVLAYYAQLHADLARGEAPKPFRGDLEYLRKDGSPYWCEVLAFPLLHSDGSFAQLLGVSRDIDERKQHEAAIRQLNDELATSNNELALYRDHLEELVLARTRELADARDAAESANRAKSLLLANMSHELRTPLNHILGLNSLLKRKAADPGTQDKLEKLGQSAYALLKLINNLLDTAYAEAGQMALEETDFDLDDLLEQVARDSQGALQRKGLSLVRQRHPEVPTWLHGDAHRLAQVLGELVGNAAKFSAQGHIELAVDRVRSGAKVITLRFEVRDQGIGVPEHLSDNLFNLFTQGDASATRAYPGTGLGLGLCQRIVKLMAGSLRYANRPEGGAVFYLELPLAAAKGPRPAPDAAPDPAALVVELWQLLQERPLDAWTRWNQVGVHLAPLLGEGLAPLARAMDDFDFVTAESLLATEAKRLA